MGVGAGLYMYVVVVQKFTFAISSPDEFLSVSAAPEVCTELSLLALSTTSTNAEVTSSRLLGGTHFTKYNVCKRSMELQYAGEMTKISMLDMLADFEDFII